MRGWNDIGWVENIKRMSYWGRDGIGGTCAVIDPAYSLCGKAVHFPPRWIFYNAQSHEKRFAQLHCFPFRSILISNSLSLFSPDSFSGCITQGRRLLYDCFSTVIVVYCIQLELFCGNKCRWQTIGRCINKK